MENETNEILKRIEKGKDKTDEILKEIAKSLEKSREYQRATAILLKEALYELKDTKAKIKLNLEKEDGDNSGG